MVPQNLLDRCAQKRRRSKLKLGDFKYYLCSIKNKYFWFPRLFGVTMATSYSRSTQDFLKLSFYKFP